MILEIVKDRKENLFVLEFELLLVEKIVLRWGGEPVPAFEKSETVCKEYILFFYVRIFVFFSLFNLFD